MNWTSFHHPDISLPVIHRKVTEEWLDILCGVGELLASRGKSVLWNQSYPNLQAYHNAMTRLRKKGLLVQTNAREMLPRLTLTEDAKQARPDYERPEKFWNAHWNGVWYLLIFDVPETERHYRNTLRKFMKQMRMGCLQKSVWITPRDIRPEYNDLEKAAAVDIVAYLLETRTVLHYDRSEIVQNTWDFGRLETLHRRYLDVFSENMERLQSEPCFEDDVMPLLYQEAEAYKHAMINDPLLPRSLLPKNYLGRKVFKLHIQLRDAIAERL